MPLRIKINFNQFLYAFRYSFLYFSFCCHADLEGKKTADFWFPAAAD